MNETAAIAVADDLSRPPEREAAGARRIKACVWLVAIWLPLFILANLPVAPVVAAFAGGLQVLLLIAFIVLHMALALRWRGAATFLAIGYAVGFAFEALSIHTGVPFGWFEHHAPGPKPLGVPLYVPLGYAFLGWPAWSLACLIVRVHPSIPRGATRSIVPLLGGLILAGYDLAYDPIGSTIKGMWSYRHPGGLSGVPLSNFLGWIVTGWVIFGLFAALESRFAAQRSRATQQQVYLLLPCIVWIGLALQYPLLQLAAPAGEVVLAARRFVIADIYETATIVALLAMVPPALAAAARALLHGQSSFTARVEPSP